MTKPPYSVPSMEQIRALKSNGFKSASTFSGCGGSCLGYRMAGFRVLYANEFIPAAQETYKANHPDSYLDCRDIRQVQAFDILKILKMSEGELDLLDGSPPCASFSTAGKREDGWGKVKSYSDTKQRTDDLFFEYARLLKGIQPKVFVAENVSGLVKGTAKGYFLEILKTLKDCGYNVKAQLLDAQWLGVPQMRQRIIFIGVRNDLGLDPVHAKPLGYRYSLRDALPHINSVSNMLTGKQPGMQDASLPWDTVTTGNTGGNGRHCVEASLSKDRMLDQPMATVQAGAGSRTSSSWEHGTCLHPVEKRKLTIDELKRICAFPDDFILTGTYAQQWERLGRSVPPVMMSHIAATIRDEILCKL